MKRLQIMAAPADKGGCGHYRVIDPMEALRQNQDHNVGFMEGDFVDEKETLHFMSGADVFVFQRPRTAKQVAFFKTFKKDPNKLLVFEHDDNTWDLHPLSDHYRWHGTTDIAIPIKQYPGSVKRAKEDGKTVKDGMVWLWEHGKNGYDVIENYHKRKNFENCMKLADVVTCTTPRLKELFEEKLREYKNPAKVYDLPNCLDLRRWMPVDIRHDDIRILWQGGASHQPDLAEVKDALTEICKKYPNVTIVMGAVNFSGITKAINPKQVSVWDNWVDFGAFPYRTALYGADIGIIPIKDMFFNGFKSDCKYSEYAALEIPTVASDLTPYNESITHNKNGLLAKNTTKDWVKQLTRLIEDEKLRRKIGKAGRKWVETHRDVKKRAPEWASVYQKELKNKRAKFRANDKNPKTLRRPKG